MTCESSYKQACKVLGTSQLKFMSCTCKIWWGRWMNRINTRRGRNKYVQQTRKWGFFTRWGKKKKAPPPKKYYELHKETKNTVGYLITSLFSIIRLEISPAIVVKLYYTTGQTHYPYKTLKCTSTLIRDQSTYLGHLYLIQFTVRVVIWKKIFIN